MKKKVLIAKNLILAGFLVVCSTWQVFGESKPPSFAIITDLHIGFGIPDYYPEGAKEYPWLDTLIGNEGTYCNPTGVPKSTIIEEAIETIIKEKDNYNIKFVVILGDISDRAEKSEFLRAREILNRLNEAGLPYIPLIGNHDVWPYALKNTPDFNPHARGKKYWKSSASCACGDSLFEVIFWKENVENKKLLESLFGISWKKDSVPTTLPEVKHRVYLQNYGFRWEGITFVCLDLAPRHREPGDILGSEAKHHEQTVKFSLYYTEHFKSQKDIVILLSHYPLGSDGGSSKFVTPHIIPPSNALSTPAAVLYPKVLNFAGHVHSTSRFPVNEIVTEDLDSIRPKFKPSILEYRTGKPIRIVQIKEKDIDYSTMLPISTSSILYIGRETDTSEFLNLYAINPDGSGFKKILSNFWRLPRNFTQITLSPDGKEIAMIAFDTTDYIYSPTACESKAPRALIKIITLKGKLKKIFRTNLNYWDEPCELKWSPDKKKLCFRCIHYRGGSSFYVINIDETECFRFATFPSSDLYTYHGYYWWPDSRKIIILLKNNKEGNKKYYITDIDKRISSYEHLEPLDFFSDIFYPSLSPDSRKIAYRKNDELWVGEFTEGKIEGSKCLTIKDKWQISKIYWSPDGSKILFYSNRGWAIINSEGGKPIIFPTLGSYPDVLGWSAEDMIRK